MVILKEFFEKTNLEKNQQTTNNHEKFPSMQTVKKYNVVPRGIANKVGHSGIATDGVNVVYTNNRRLYK